MVDNRVVNVKLAGIKTHIILQLDHTVDIEIPPTEARWFEGVKEAIYIKAMRPSFTRDGQRYSLPPLCITLSRS